MCLVLIPNSNFISYKATQSGVYKVKIIDPKNCSLESVCNVTVKVNKCSSCNLTATVISTNVKCSGYGDGKIVVSATGEQGSYSFSINGGSLQTSNTFANLIEGTYAITAYKTSAQSCKAFASASIKANKIIYNKINITTNTSTACDKADLVATIINNPPSSCDFTFERTSPNQYGDWPADILSVSLLANGTQELFNSSSRKVFTTSVTVPNGSSLSVVVKNIGISAGSSGSDKWVFNIKSPDGAIVGTYTVNPSTSFPKGSTTVIAPFNALCKFTPPVFTYNWTNGLFTNPTSLTTSVTVNSNSYAKIIAANPSAPECPLIDSILVKYTCVTSCVKPTKPVIVSSAGTSICVGANTNFSVVLQTGKYYLWYKDNVAIGTATLNSNTLNNQTSIGTYKIRVVDDIAKINDATCYIESDDFILTNTASPSSVITTHTSLSFCEGNTGGTLIAQDAGQGATYEWFKDLNSVGAASTNAIYNNALEGKWKVKSTLNGCSTLSDEVIVTKTLKPEAIITNTELGYCKDTDGLTLTAKELGNTITYEWFKDTQTQGLPKTDNTFTKATVGKWKVKVANSTYSQPTLISQFDFNDNLTDALGNSKCNPINLDYMKYNSGTLDWATKNTSTGGGLQLLIPDALFTEDDYIIEVDFQFSKISNSWDKIWDFKNQNSDAGLYFYGGGLQLFPNTKTGPNKVKPKTNYTVVLSRNGVTDSTMGSVMFNGVFSNESATSDVPLNPQRFY